MTTPMSTTESTTKNVKQLLATVKALADAGLATEDLMVLGVTMQTARYALEAAMQAVQAAQAAQAAQAEQSYYEQSYYDESTPQPTPSA